MGDRFLAFGCFGKLPFWREYLEGGTRTVASRALRVWLRAGRELLVLENAGEDDYAVADTALEAHLRVLMSLPDSQDLLVGVIRASRDAGGRHAPFIVFASLARKLYGRHYALLPSALGGVWEALADAWETLHEVPSRAGFDEACASIEIPAPVDVKQARGGYQGRHLDNAGAVFDEESLEEFRSNMPGIFASIKKNGGRDVCVGLPAAGDVAEAAFNASLWIDLVNRQFRLRRYDPSVMFDAREGLERRQVYLKYGPLVPEDYVRFLGDLSTAGVGGDVLRPVASTAAGPGGPVATTYGQLLETVF